MLRGVAATAVVVHHAYRYVEPNSHARLGSAGVDLFFVISGFIMATVAANKRPAEFMFDRIWRIFPMWLIAVAPWLLILPHAAPQLATTFTLWPIWGGQFYFPAMLLGWSLCFEMLFYWSFAVALATRPVVPLAIFALVFAIGPQHSLLSFVGSPLVLEFLCGVAVARLPLRSGGAALIPIAIVLLWAAPVDFYSDIMGYGALQRFLWWGIPAAMLVYGARSIESAFERRAFSVPVLIGNASYSIYLFHRFVVRGEFDWRLQVVAAVAVGVGLHVTLERWLVSAKPRLGAMHSAARQRFQRSGPNDNDTVERAVAD